MKDKSHLLSYTAGFFDGEGSIVVRFKKDKRYKSGIHILIKVNVTQKDRKVLEDIRSVFVCGHVYFHKRDKLWYLEIYRIREIEKFINAILPYSRVKKVLKIIKKKEHLSSDVLKKIKILWLGPETGANTP